MTGPKTLNAAIRASHERSPAAAASRRYRVRKRGGYVRTGPVDVPPELVWVMVDSGILPPEYVTQDGRHLRVEPGIMAEAWRSLQELLADRDDEFLDFLKDNIQNCQRRSKNPPLAGVKVHHRGVVEPAHFTRSYS